MRLSFPQIPRTVEIYTLDIPIKKGREKLREQFYKNANARDPRVIDMLVMKVREGAVYFDARRFIVLLLEHV